MPAPLAFRRQMAQFGLDPLKAYTKSDVNTDGHIKRRVEHPVLPPVVVKKEEAPKGKPSEADKKASTAPPAPKSDKSVKPVPAKPVQEPKKVETPVASQAAGEKTSDETNVEPKETAPVASVGGAEASTVKP